MQQQMARYAMLPMFLTVSHSQIIVKIYLSPTDATFPIPSNKAPLVRRLMIKLRNSVSASAGKLVSSKERL